MEECQCPHSLRFPPAPRVPLSLSYTVSLAPCRLYAGSFLTAFLLFSSTFYICLCVHIHDTNREQFVEVSVSFH